MKRIACFILCCCLWTRTSGNSMEPSVEGSTLAEESAGFEDFLKDIVMATESRRVRRQPVEEVLGRTVLDVLTGRAADDLGRVTRDVDGNQMLIMGSPFAGDHGKCGNGQLKDAEPYPWQVQPVGQYYQNYGPSDDQYPHVERTLPPRVLDSRTVAEHSLPALGGIQVNDGLSGGINHAGLTHIGNLGGLGLPGLANLGNLGLGGGLGGGLHGGGAIAGGSIAAPIKQEAHIYVTTIPYISGYKMTPIVSEKQVIVKDFPKDIHGGLLHHKTLPGLGARSSSHSRDQDFYIEGPQGDRHPLDLNIFFVDPEEAKRSSEPELMAPEVYADAVRQLQQKMDHLQSLKLAQERRSQPEELNYV